jgi:hypothetical protein
MTGHDETRSCALDGNESGGVGRAGPDTESGVRFAWSFDEEHYHGEEASREAALAAAMEEADDREGCWTGRIVPIPVETLLPSGYRIVEEMAEAAYDEHGIDDWLDDVTKEQEAELETAVRGVAKAWLEKHKNWPRFWTVEDTKEHVFALTANHQESASPAPHADLPAPARPDEARTTDTKE